MNTRYRVPALLLILLTLVFTSGFAGAASIKQRMASRIPTINTLKDQGLVGENNRGFLEYRTGQHPSQTMIDAENSDRNTVYGAIAKKQGVSVTLVGQRRAKMLADKGDKGHWFQSPNGKWYQK